MILRVHHVGIAVRDLDEALRFWELALGMKARGTEDVPAEGVRVALLPAGEAGVELLEPLSPDSPVGRFLLSRGEGVHHLTLEVDDIEEALRRLRAAGVRFAGEAPREGAAGTRVAFLHPSSTGGVLVELVEDSRRAAGREIHPGEAVLVYLKDPHEKLWGVLHRLDAAGILLEGIDLGSFDDWVAQIERGDENVVGPSTIFLPMSRVERILLDRPSGRLPSLADRFRERTGRTVQEALGETAETDGA